MTLSTQPGPGRGLMLLTVAVLFSVGVPGFLLWLFPEKTAEHTLLSVFLLMVYEISLLVFGFAIKIWEKLESRWTERMAGWIDRNLQTWLSSYLRPYRHWIFYQHRDFDVKGLTTQGVYNLELDQVFVDLTIEPKPAHATSADPIRRVPLELAGRRQVWDYIENEELKDNLVLIGPPGSGKTTLLKKIALQMTGRKPPSIRQTVPILLFLREHAEAIASNPGYSLVEAVRSALARKEGPTPPDGWFEGKLRAGRCLLLFDGLDEVAKSDIRRKVVAWVEDRMKAHAKNRFLITSRPHGYRSNPISGVTVLEVQPFSRRQVDKFIRNWYRANEIRASGKNDPGVEMKAREGSADLLQRLAKSPTLIELAVNPLLLTMIATVHRFRSSLPGRRVELYAEICEVFLGKRQQAREIAAELTPSQKQRALQPLAYQLMQSKRREIQLEEAVQIVSQPLRRITGDRFHRSEQEFLQEIENGSGLLLEREFRVYNFAHLAFQEYLAAVHAREEDLGQALARQVTEPWWHETIRLYCAQEDATPILEACLSTAQPTAPVLALAIDCMEEAREVDPKWRGELERLLALGIEDRDLESFRLAAEAFLSRRLRDMVPQEEIFIDLTYISHAEFQLFLDEQAATGHYLQPDHWVRRRFPAGLGRLPIVGVRLSDARSYCVWLSQRDTLYNYRLPLPGELEQHNLQDIPSAQTGTAEGYWTRFSKSLSEIGFERCLPPRQRLSRANLGKIIEADLRTPPPHDPEDIISSLAFATLKNLADFDPASLPLELDEQTPLQIDVKLERFQSFAYDRAARTSYSLKNLLDNARAQGTSDRFGESSDRHFQSILKRALRLVDLTSYTLNKNIIGALDFAQELLQSCRQAFDCFLDLDVANQSGSTALGQAQQLAHSLSSTIALIYTASLVLTRSYNPEVDLISRWALRIFTLDLALYTQDIPVHSQALWSYEPYRQLHALRQKALPLYADLLRLEARITGELQAFEGVRVIKERKS